MKRYDYQWYWNGLISALGIMFFAGTLSAQVQAPQTKGVYGGIMSYIAALSNDATTRVYVSADSAAAVFYADMDFSKPNPFGTNLMFQAVPGLTYADNRGMPDGMAVHVASARLFISTPSDGLLSCTQASNSLVTNVSANIYGVVIEGSRLAYVRSDNRTIKLGYGTLSADGVFTESGAPATVMTNSDGNYNNRIGVHPTNQIVYLNGLGKFEQSGQYTSFTNIVRSSDSIENLSAGTVFTPLVLPNLTTNWTSDTLTGDRTFGFGPDGRIFVGGYNPANTNLPYSSNRGWELIYSDDNGGTWSSAITGGSGCRLWTTVGDPAGDPANYWVYNGNSVSTNKGVNWQIFGTKVPGARLSNRRVVADPTHPLVLYCVTECGLGVCTNGGMTNDLDTIQNISRGIEAAVVNDFDLTADKNIAWIAANGIRRATNFQGTPEWSDPKFPMGNDACNYVAVDKSDTNGLVAYAGGINVYKTVNGGPVESDPSNPTNWTWVFNPNAFGFESNGICYVRISTIEAYGNIVALGLRSTASNSKGALVLSTDGGSNWNEVVLHSGGVDVTKLLLTRESGTNVLYATVANDYLSTAYGVFRINVADTNITHELTDNVNMHDLAVASNGTLYASGFDLQTNVVLYSKGAGADVWAAVSLSGYPPTKMAAVSGDAPLVTVGLDSSSNEVPYMLASKPPGYAIYYMVAGGTNTTWETLDALRYQSCTQIKVLFWDDLLVGTSMGLYGQMFQSGVTIAPTALAADFDGDRLADPAVYLPAVSTPQALQAGDEATGTWKTKLSSANYYLVVTTLNGLGGPGYASVAADYDGDGKADPAVYNEQTSSTGSGRAGVWAIMLSSANYEVVVVLTQTLGGIGYSGMPADYDGDRLADPGVYKRESGDWRVMLSSANYSTLELPGLLGGTGYRAVAADYDGDNKADPAVYDENNGYWIFKLSSIGYVELALAQTLGGAGYMPCPGDFDGDGLADPAVKSTIGNEWVVMFSAGNYTPVHLMLSFE